MSDVRGQHKSPSARLALAAWRSLSAVLLLFLYRKRWPEISPVGLTQRAGNERNYGGHKSSFIDEGPAECFSADAIKSSGLDIN